MVDKVSSQPKPAVGRSAAVRAGDMIFVAGQLAFDANGDVVQGGVEAKVTRCFRNVERHRAVWGNTQ